MIRYTKECLETAEQGFWLTDKPEGGRGSRPKSIRVFQNPFLELISRAHPATPGIWFGPFVVWFLISRLTRSACS